MALPYKITKVAHDYTYLQTSKNFAKDLHQAKGSLNCLCIVTKGRRNATHLSRKSLCSIIGRRKSRAWIMLCFSRRLWYLSYVERILLGNILDCFLHRHYSKSNTKFCNFLFYYLLVGNALCLDFKVRESLESVNLNILLNWTSILSLSFTS